MSEFQVILKVPGKPDQAVAVNDPSDSDGPATLTQEELEQILLQAGSDKARATFVINGTERDLAALRALVGGGGAPIPPPTPPAAKPADLAAAGWVPVVTSALSFGIDKGFYDDTTYLPGLRLQGIEHAITDGEPFPLVLFSLRFVMDTGTTMLYTRLQPGMEEPAALIYDGIFLVVGGVMMGVSFSVDSGADPFMHLALRSFTDVGAARAHRHLDRGWAGLIQLGLGAIFIPVGLAGCEGRPTVSERDMYVDPDTVTSHYGVSGNPYEGTRFPNLCTNVTQIGVIHAFDGIVHLIQRAAKNEGPGAPPVSVTLLPGGPGHPIGGAYVGVDLMELLR